MRFWALVHRNNSVKECFVALYILDVPLFHISCTIFAWTTIFWNWWRAFALHLRILMCLFALQPSRSRRNYYSNVLIKLKDSSLQVSQPSIISYHDQLVQTIRCILGCKYPKSRRFFWKINRQVERLSETIFTVVMKTVVQILILPKCVVSFATYLISDLASDSFQLPIPLW